MPFKRHIISDAPLSPHDTVDCDLSFENVLVLNMFWRIREEYFLLSQFIWDAISFPPSQQDYRDLDSERYELEI